MSDEGPPRSGRDGVLWRAVRRLAVLADSSVRLDAPAGNAFLAAKSNAHLGGNAYYDGSGNWRPYVAGAPALAWQTDAANGRALLRYQAVAADPIAWTDTPVGQDSGWLAAPTLAASWSQFDATNLPVQYRLYPDGTVRLRGLLAKSVAIVANEIVFTLPAGYRPSKKVHCAVDSNDAHGSVGVTTGGGLEARAGSNVWLSLDQVSFSTT